MPITRKTKKPATQNQVTAAAEEAVAKKTKVNLKKAEEKPVEKVVENVEDTVELSVEDPEEQDAKRALRAARRKQPFDEIYAEIRDNLNVGYTNIQSVHRSISRLLTAHRRETSAKTHREVRNRTPTALFSKSLIDWLKANLSDQDFVIHRKQGGEKVEVDLCGITTETPVFRTDLTQLYTTAVKNSGLQNAKDGRGIEYSRDPDLVALLTNGASDKHAEEIAQIKAGTYKLTLFNIQKFLGHHINTVEREA